MDLKRILIIDDEVGITETIAEIFRFYGHHVDTANDGIDGLNLIKSSAYDLILLDIVMPGMHGNEVYAEIQKIRPAARVIVITGYSDDHQLVKQIREQGVSELFHKPFDFDTLVDSIKTL